MNISVFDLFKVGIGPSSSHTVGPMKAAYLFTQVLQDKKLLASTYRIKAEMFGSLGATGKGHGTPKALLMGLEGYEAESIDVEQIPIRVAHIKDNHQLLLAGKRIISFNHNEDIVLHKRKSLPFHSNGMMFFAYDDNQQCLLEKSYYSIGGGFVHDDSSINKDQIIQAQPESDVRKVPYPFTSAKTLLEICQQHQLSISELMMANETVSTSKSDIHKKLLTIWQVMQLSVNKGCHASGTLPGGLNIPRRAPALFQKLEQQRLSAQPSDDPLLITDWITLYALAVNEENAAGGRIVTAPTNGAAGIIPAVMHYYQHFVPNANDAGIIQFLLTAAAIGTLYKINASISGAEVGCQGEVGSACSMAAGALCEVMGGTPEQVENAAEIAMEHNLGLTCDPIGGLVQIPCIERNAMAAIKAVSACRMALLGDGSHFVSLDKVIKTMRITGRDMRDKYKETSRGGLAINVLDVPVNIIEC